MEPSRRFRAKIKNGGIYFYQPTEYSNFLKNKGESEVWVIVNDLIEEVTEDQHGYYRGIIIQECLKHEKYGGWSADDVHDFFAGIFLSYKKIYEIGDKSIEVPKVESTAKIGKKRMIEFIDKVLNFLAEQEIFPPEPLKYDPGKYATRKIKAESKTDDGKRRRRVSDQNEQDKESLFD